MKNINDLLSNCFRGCCDLKKLRDDYQEIVKELETTTTSLEKMPEKDRFQGDSQLTLTDKLNLFKILQLSDIKSQVDFDIYQLMKKLLDAFPDLEKYCQLQRRQDILKKRQLQILTNKVCLENFNDDYCCQHQFIRVADQLMCINCGKTTQEYHHTIEDIDFLVECAIAQGLFIAEVTQEEVPLIMILKGQFDYFKENTDQIHQIRMQLKRARMLDKGIFEDNKTKVSNPKYFTDDEALNLLRQVEREAIVIKKLNSRFKDLLLEQCRVARYEILILSGLNIPVILANYVENDTDVTALAKAYYNLMNDSFRINSGYFRSENNAAFYTCLTTNKHINQKVLELKR